MPGSLGRHCSCYRPKPFTPLKPGMEHGWIWEPGVLLLQTLCGTWSQFPVFSGPQFVHLCDGSVGGVVSAGAAAAGLGLGGTDRPPPPPPPASGEVMR